ncbi:MAG TPA: amidohydrolase family protein [Edaphobacter sp.]|nr:amidohydrolase family protein [Edaphobacter sp.]
MKTPSISTSVFFKIAVRRRFAHRRCSPRSQSGAGVPFALPALCIPAAKKYPGLNIILAHAGMAVFTAEAQVAASVCGNLYLETSWCIGEDIRWMISTIGPDRVMMGADLPSNVPVEIAKYRSLDLTPEVYDRVMGGTALEVFKLKW